MHALAPTPNPSLHVHVLPDMKCDGGSVSGLMPISLQEGVCWSEAPLRCTKGPYMAKPCSPVLITSSTLQPKERFQWSPVRLCMLTALGKRGISSYQPLNFYHSTHSLVVKCMLWFPTPTPSLQVNVSPDMKCDGGSVSGLQTDAYKLARRHLLVRSTAPLH